MAERLKAVFAHTLLAECLKIARNQDHAVAVAIVDDGGNLMAFQRHENAFLAATEVSIAKAKTAHAFQRSTAEMQQTLEEGKFSYLSLPSAVPLAGGMPIVVNSRCIGGLGICGAPSAVDQEIAITALSTVVSN